MTSIPDAPDGEDLAALREEIDRLKAIPEEELVDPTPASLKGRELEPEPTDAIGSEKWDRPASEESLGQE
ncbi:hypothetical protein [Microbacterium pygmaeum]|uniref:Uncharacterized protein n=1 Tax=Microbacterium pygmaeum TaxID=370764 RepID=A0A1G7ZAW6_9MICO|nr:hypothetical protein [Microbacterium pygmaeum]SDH05747.1 hypothetical protein SAMN04489810_2001 [Microbacterium pygmaeum]